MDMKDVFTNEGFFQEALSDCIDAGASLQKKGLDYRLRFPEAPDRNPFYVGFSLLEEEDVRLFSDVDGFSGQLEGDEFMDSLDILSAKMLSVYDGIDRGV